MKKLFEFIEHIGRYRVLVQSRDIQNGAIKSSHIVDDAVTTDKLADGAVTTDKIADNAVTGAKIADGAVTEEKIKNSSIEGRHIVDYSITGRHIDDNTITSDKIVNYSITGDKLHDDAVTTDKLHDGAVTTDKILNDAVTTDKLHDDAVTTDKIVNEAVTQAKIHTGAVTSEKIKNGSVEGRHILGGAITGDKIARDTISGDKFEDYTIDGGEKLINNTLSGSKLKDNTVPGSKLVDEAITTNKIIDNSVTTDKLHDDAVTTDKIAANAVTTDKIGLGAVDGRRIAVGAVQSLHIAPGSVGGTNLADGSITTIHIQSNAVTESKIGTGAVTANKIVDNAVTESKIGTGAVTTSKIADNAVTENKLADGAITPDKIAASTIEQLQTIMDEEPTAGSSKPVMSGGVYDVITALHNGLLGGTLIPALANNLASWAGSTQNATYTQENIVETTGGDLSIDSSVPATLVSIAAKTDFSATKLVATGFNLLRRATALNIGWYFMVPALPYGAINTAIQPNGILFTNAQGVNLRPHVRFKPLSQGVPTSVLDGVECPYTNAASGLALYRFYNPTEAGYLILAIDRDTTCAHIGWSKRYDEYISVTDPNDAGSEVNIAAGIHALHTYDKMLTVGNSADRIERTGDNQVTWHRLVDRVQPTWTTTPVESEGEPTGDYIHTATISGMKSGGAAAFETLDITLIVDGTTISFTDQNATVENDYVKYELATEVTGTAAVSSSFTVEDWGLIIIEGAVGSAYINIAYAQGIPDSVRQMLSNIDNKTIPVIAEALLYLYNENKALRELLTGNDNAVLPYIKAQTIECNDMLTMGVPDVLVCSEEGAPSAANVPDNWDETTMTVWNGCPRKVGQQYVDKASGKVYYAIKVTGSTNDWVALN